jgi:cytochrome c-type biogenesis protein CcmF
VAGLVVGLAVGIRDPFALATLAFASWALVCNLREYQVGAAARMKAHGESAPVAVGRLVAANQRRYGGYVAHMGIIMMAVAIAASSSYKYEKEATLKPGATMQLRSFDLRFKEVWGRDEPHRQVIGADIEVLDKTSGNVLGVLDPRLNFYPTQDQPVPTPSVRSRPWGDLYLNLMAFTPDGSTATIRAIEEPLVPWIWIGGFVVAFGAVISGWPTRRNAGRRMVPARPAPVSTGGFGSPAGAGVATANQVAT